MRSIPLMEAPPIMCTLVHVLCSLCVKGEGGGDVSEQIEQRGVIMSSRP